MAAANSSSVKDRVREDVIKIRAAELSKQKAAEIASALRSAKDFAAGAKAQGLEAKDTQLIARGSGLDEVTRVAGDGGQLDEEQDRPAAAVKQLFDGERGAGQPAGPQLGRGYEAGFTGQLGQPQQDQPDSPFAAMQPMPGPAATPTAAVEPDRAGFGDIHESGLARRLGRRGQGQHDAGGPVVEIGAVHRRPPGGLAHAPAQPTVEGLGVSAQRRRCFGGQRNRVDLADRMVGRGSPAGRSPRHAHLHTSEGVHHFGH